MKDKKIKTVKQWLKPQSVRDIQVFLGFANFYQRFIQEFCQTAALLTLMLKTSESTESKTRSGESKVGVGGSKARQNGSGFDGSRIDDNEVDDSKVGNDKVEKKVQKSSKSKNLSKSDFLTPGAKLAFTKLRQAFVKALILHHFDPKRHIWIEMDVFSYAIGGILSQLTLDDLGRWYPVAFFLQKMIPAETRYEIHDSKLLAIVKAFKTWRHYLKGS